ncbi:MAG: NifB/NifX family molybdenum-iron cluster-binding protein [Chloroflexota bacterium]
MILCAPVTITNEIDPRWGRASRVAIVEVHDGDVVGWQAFDVAWDTLHDTGSEGGHHARVARFLQEHGVQVVVADHMGDPMAQMLTQMGIESRLGAGGDARQAILAAAEAGAD